MKPALEGREEEGREATTKSALEGREATTQSAQEGREELKTAADELESADEYERRMKTPTRAPSTLREWRMTKS